MDVAFLFLVLIPLCWNSELEPHYVLEVKLQHVGLLNLHALLHLELALKSYHAFCHKLWCYDLWICTYRTLFFHLHLTF